MAVLLLGIICQLHQPRRGTTWFTTRPAEGGPRFRGRLLPADHVAMQVQRPRSGLLRTAFLTTLAGTLTLPILALGDDRTPVVLQSLHFAPTAIDTSTGAAQVT